VLEPYRDNEIVQRVLEFRKAAKLAGTYGRKFLEKHQEADGRIYSHYWTYGAQSGRMASSDPNLQNIPNSPEFRSGFVAAPGHKLIVADYSQQESRIAAAISNDAFLLDLFRRGEDIHLMVARQIYDDDTITKDDPRRFLGKTLNLAITYGLTAPSFAKRVTQWNHQRGIKRTLSTAEAQTLIDSYFKTCRGIRAYIDTQRLRGQRDGRVTTRLGRVIHLNLYNDQWMNIAINAPIQGGAADQMKMALVSLFRRCREQGLEFPVVTVVHDEIVAEVPTEQTALYSDLIERCMLAAGERLYPEVVWKVGVAVGDNWGVKEWEAGMGAIRKFSTGATRDTDENKPDYESYLSPIVIARYGSGCVAVDQRLSGENAGGDRGRFVRDHLQRWRFATRDIDWTRCGRDRR